MEQDKHVTLKMIAERAGTSLGTVDRALNGRPGVSAQQRAQILAVAQALGYRPNPAASALGRKKGLRIAVVYPANRPEFFGLLDAGVNEASLELAGYGIQTHKLRYESQTPELAAACLRGIDPQAYDGLVVNAPGEEAALLLAQYAAAGLPVAAFNTDTDPGARLFYVGADSRRAGLLGGELLALLLDGSGRVAVLGGLPGAAPFAQRYAGFREALREQGPEIRISHCAACRQDVGEIAQSLSALLARSPDINAVFCTGYTSTLAAITAIRSMNRPGLRLVGFDVTEPTVAALREGLCTALLYQDPRRQGYTALRLLGRYLLEGVLPAQGQTRMETQIVLKNHLEGNEAVYLPARE